MYGNGVVTGTRRKKTEAETTRKGHQLVSQKSSKGARTCVMIHIAIGIESLREAQRLPTVPWGTSGSELSVMLKISYRQGRENQLLQFLLWLPQAKKERHQDTEPEDWC